MAVMWVYILDGEAVARAAALFAIWRNVMDRKLIHVCEVCGKTEILTPEEAFNDGWEKVAIGVVTKTKRSN